MQRLPNFHPSDTTKFPLGSGKVQLNASNEGSKVLMYNETPLNIDLDFLNGKSDVLHAWEANFWTLDGDTKEIDWNIDVDSLNVVNPPINAVFLTLYDPIEKLNDKAYPMPLIRQIGGQQAIVSSASQVINDGNALQQVVEATLQGHGSSDVIINNDGSYTIKGAGLIAAVGILTHILGTLTVDGVLTAPAANVLGTVGVLTHILGTLTVDQLATLTAGLLVPNNVAIQGNDSTGVAHNLLSVLANNHVVIGPAGQGIDQVDGSGNIIFRTTSTAVIANKQLQVVGSSILLDNNQAVNAKDSLGASQVLVNMNTDNTARIASGAGGAAIVATDNANALTTLNAKIVACATGGNFKGIAGTLSRFTFFTGNGSGTYSHTQGVTPQWVAAIANVAGSFTQGFDTPTSTQVHITCGAALAFTACVLNS